MSIEKAIIHWSLLGAGLLALILVPFVLFEGPINQAVGDFVAAPHEPLALAGVLISLLALDIFLPIPSSVVGTAAGVLLGLAPGVTAIWIGLTAGCLLGYLFGGSAGRALVGRVAGAGELERIERVAERRGAWVIILFRAVPVLAEASVVWAGASRMPLSRFLLISSLANLGIAAIYGSVGAMAADGNAFIWAFAASLAVPGAAMVVARRLR